MVLLILLVEVLVVVDKEVMKQLVVELVEMEQLILVVEVEELLMVVILDLEEKV